MTPTTDLPLVHEILSHIHGPITLGGAGSFTNFTLLCLNISATSFIFKEKSSVRMCLGKKKLN